MRLNHAQGQAAENAALTFLQAQGLTLQARNWHCRFGEIDLIMQDGDCLVFIEVRYRKQHTFGGAAASIDARKLARLYRSAEYYLQQKAITCPCRLDAVILQGDDAPQWLRNITC
ncbi:YraN family protein [Neisseriaceae bacterium ESL0693]|nr:YraN family protein [Neisseriaceae bacterium ESL0693]